jgi:hypothetical protein
LDRTIINAERKIKSFTEFDKEALFMKTLKGILARVNERRELDLSSSKGKLKNRLFWNQVITSNEK